MPAPSAGDRFLVVRLERDLNVSRRNALVYAIRQHPGIVSVCDLSAISQATLDVMLLAPDPVPVERTPRVEQLELSA